MIALHLKARKPRLDSADLLRFSAQAQMAAKLRGDVGLCLTEDREMRELNRRFRRKNKPTDVLSFPAPSDLRGYAGDLAISLDIARENARRYGHTLSEEVKVLILHGMLHLAGHDHEKDDGRMARLEARLREDLGLPNGLIARTMNGGKKRTPARRARKAGTR